MIVVGIVVAIFGPRLMGGLAYVCAVGCFAIALVDPLERRRHRRYERCRDGRRRCLARQQMVTPHPLRNMSYTAAEIWRAETEMRADAERRERR